jgi:response regulator of citrate/malate metabolism
MSRYKILIVEDEFIPANYLRKILQQSGHKVIGIADSKESVMKYIDTKTEIDLVLMDIRIKGKSDGIQIAKIIQSYMPINILFLSAYSDTDFLERAKDINSIGYLVKPIQAKTLLSTIEIGMSQSKSTMLPDTISLCAGMIFDVAN